MKSVHERIMNRERERIAGVVLSLTAVALAAMLAQVSPALAEDAATRRFAAHVLAFRSAGVAGEGGALEVLEGLPGATGEGEAASVLWRPFFENAMVKLGRLRSPAPVALYYNPLLDVAIIAVWERHERGYRVAAARALPGERLAGVGAEAPLRPGWLAAEDGLVRALAAQAGARLAAFGAAHPEEASAAAGHGATFAAAAADMRAAWPRLAWNAVQRAEWAAGRPRWLGPALARVETALSARDATAIVKAAPGTDAATADTLAVLPPGFAAGLALDMVLDACGRKRRSVEDGKKRNVSGEKPNASSGKPNDWPRRPGGQPVGDRFQGRETAVCRLSNGMA